MACSRKSVRDQRRQAAISLPAAPGGALLRRLEGDRRRRRLLARHAEGEGASDLFAILLGEMAGAGAEADDVALVSFVKGRSRDAHLIVAGMPVFSAAWWKGRDFDAATLEAPLGSGAYKVASSSRAASSNSRATTNYWGRDLPVNVGHNNFAAALRILPRAAGRVRGVQGRRDQLPSGIHLAHLGDRL